MYGIILAALYSDSDRPVGQERSQQVDFHMLESSDIPVEGVVHSKRG
jgi:hypothetical protein